MGIRAAIDLVFSSHVAGWACDEDDGLTALDIRIVLDTKVIGTAVADGYRQDLEQAGIGTGRHGFSADLAVPIAEGDLENLRIVASDKHGVETEIALAPGGPSLSRMVEIGDLRAGWLQKMAAPSDVETNRDWPLYAQSLDLKPPAGYPADFLAGADFVSDKVLSDYATLANMDPLQIVACVKQDKFPIPHLNNREGYSPGFDLIYWLSGFTDFRRIRQISHEYGVSRGRIFDFGGSTGRVFRHFLTQTDLWQVWSSDFKPTSVEFNQIYFAPYAKCFLNSHLPSLPIPDGYFDLVIACSVFTHIDETEIAWLLELRRTTRIGGILCLSVHNEETWANRHDLYNMLKEYRPDIADLPTLPRGKTVARFRDDDPYNCNTFHSAEYLQTRWGMFFEVCSIRPLFLGQQAMVVLRRTE